MDMREICGVIMDQDTEHAQLHQQELEEREQLESSQPWWWDQDKDQDWIKKQESIDERIQNHT